MDFHVVSDEEMREPTESEKFLCLVRDLKDGQWIELAGTSREQRNWESNIREWARKGQFGGKGRPVFRRRKGRQYVRFEQTPYSGTHCELCGQNLSGLVKGDHLKANHPEYQFKVVTDGYQRSHYCDTCGRSVGSPSGVIRHYRELHPEKVKHGL